MADLIGSIEKARKIGADNDTILEEIIRQNPKILPSYIAAKETGADTATILNEVIKQNVPNHSTKGFFAPEPTGKSPYKTGSSFTTPTFPYQAGESRLETAGEIVGNLPTSVIRTTEGLGEFVFGKKREGGGVFKGGAAFNIDPEKNFFVQLSQAAIGTGMKLGRKITGVGEKELPQFQEEKIAEAVGADLYKRYGSLENIKRSLAEDPFVVLSLVRSIARAASTGLKSAAALSPTKTPTLSPLAQKTAGAIDTALEVTKPTSIVSAVGKTGKKVFTTIAEKRIPKAIDSLEYAYKDIERGWVTTRKASVKAERVTELKNKTGTIGRTPERVLAENGIIPEHKGTEFTTVIQAKKLRNQANPLFKANREALKEIETFTPKKSIQELKAAVMEEINAPKNIASGNAIKMRKIAGAEMKAYGQEYGENVSITTIDDIKTARWGETPFSLTKADKLKSNVDYAIGKAMQKTIEKMSTYAGAKDVAQLNREIGDILEAAKFLENLDGKKVLYGRMGTHMMRLSGAIIGSKGGFLGSFLGAIGGNALARILRNISIASPYKRLLLKNLQQTNPESFIDTLQWLKQQGLDRELRLLLPAPTGTGSTLNQGRPIPVLPRSSNRIDYTGKERIVVDSPPKRSFPMGLSIEDITKNPNYTYMTPEMFAKLRAGKAQLAKDIANITPAHRAAFEKLKMSKENPTIQDIKKLQNFK